MYRGVFLQVFMWYQYDVKVYFTGNCELYKNIPKQNLYFVNVCQPNFL